MPIRGRYIEKGRRQTGKRKGKRTKEAIAARVVVKQEKVKEEDALWEQAKESVANDDPNLLDLALARIKEDPWWWFCNYVYTYDSTDDTDRVKRFPQEKDYFRWILETIQRDKIVYIVKTRQVMASWFVSGLATWKTQFFPYSEGYVQCNNEDTVNYFVGKRIKCIYDHLPEWQKRPESQFKYLQMYNPDTNSNMVGIPSGSDKARGRVPSVFLADELAFQETGKDSIMAVLPAIKGNAWFLGPSTPNGKNFFHDLIHPRRKKHIETIYPIPEFPKSKIERYEGFTVIFLHYTADPEKRTKEWYQAERAKFFASGKNEDAWDQEYELSFDISSNPRLYPTYDPAIHERILKFNPFRPIMRGWDFGKRRPACAFMQVNSKNQLELLWAILGAQWDIHEFVGHVQRYCTENFLPGLHDGRAVPIRYEDFCDHAGTQETDKGSTVRILRQQYHIHPRSRYSKPEERAILVADYLKVRKSSKADEPAEPGMYINKDCPLLCEGFRGGFQSKPDAMGNGTGIPFKDDFYDNVHDALGYVFDLKFGTYRQPIDEWEARILRDKRRREQRKFNKVTGYSYA
jgi:hypothetical protein